MKNTKRNAITAVLATILVASGSVGAAETITHDSFIINSDQPTIVFPDGSMVVVKQYRNGYNDYSIKYERQDFNGNVVEEHVLDMSDELLWKAATATGDLWLYNEDHVLGAWNVNSQSFSKIPLNFNSDQDKAIVNDNGNLVIFVGSTSQLTEYTPSLSIANSAAYDSCDAQMGYFECVDGGTTRYVNPTNFSSSADTDSFVERDVDYRYVRDGNNIIISDKQGNVLFNYPVHTSSTTKPVAYATSLIAFEVSSEDSIIFTDWDGNIVDSIHSFNPEDGYTFHPAGYFLYEEYKTKHFYYNDAIVVSQFNSADYLNSNNPATINGYTITISGETTPPNNGTDNPTVPGVSGTASGGGSIGLITLGLLSLFGVRRKHC